MSNELQQCREELSRKEAQIQELLQWQAHLEKDIHQLKAVLADKEEQITKLLDWQEHMQGDVERLQKAQTGREEAGKAQRDYIHKLEEDVSDLQKRLLEVETAESEQKAESQSIIRRLEEANQALSRKVDLAQLNEEKLKKREAELDELETFKAKYVLLVNEIKNQKFNHLMKVFFTKDYN
ncbi:hypothetical protein [Gorillibacterium sp. CAU 1737]|uniref:hypothetical protein n=1 Tax=Gorillibacterium sp. CAU 1737 TaxID=3140362 RepID=UPI0032616687